MIEKQSRSITQEWDSESDIIYPGVREFATLTSAQTHLVAEEATRDVNLFASNDDNLLARESLLGDDGSKTTQEMPFAVDDNRRRGESGHFWGTEGEL